MIKIVPDPTPEQIRYVTENMRSEDRVEVRTISDRDHRLVVADAVAISQEVYVATQDDVPIAVLGCHTNALAKTGVPWFLGTDAATALPVGMVKLGRRYIEYLKPRHTRLSNLVHVGNSPSRAFLSALGFDMSEPFELPNGAVVIEFSLEGTADV